MRSLLLVTMLLCAGCVTTGAVASVTAEPGVEASEVESWASWPGPVRDDGPPPMPAEEPNRLAARAASLVGLSSVHLAAPHLPDDCTGLARAVYDDSGIQLMGLGQRGDNGVTAMYRLAFEKSALHTHAPAPGDLVFFRETYDRNRDGKLNDGLTHVAVVERVEADGEVTFVHRSGSGVTRGRMNLEAPLDKHLNDYLRPARRGVAAALTGELFVAYASATQLAR